MYEDNWSFNLCLGSYFIVLNASYVSEGIWLLLYILTVLICNFIVPRQNRIVTGTLEIQATPIFDFRKKLGSHFTQVKMCFISWGLANCFFNQGEQSFVREKELFKSLSCDGVNQVLGVVGLSCKRSFWVVQSMKLY